MKTLSAGLIDIRKIKDYYEKTAVILEAKDTLPVYDVKPPKDVFFHFNRYYENNFEAIMSAVAVLYNEKADLEYAIQFYDHFDTEEKAKDFQRKNESKVISDIYTVENGIWCILGPYRTNKAKINFYNKDTDAIRRLLEQMETDNRLGSELLKKRIRREKAKQVGTIGPDAVGLETYKNAMGIMDSFGAKEALTQEEKKKLYEAQRVVEMHNVPKMQSKLIISHLIQRIRPLLETFYTQSPQKLHHLRPLIGHI